MIADFISAVAGLLGLIAVILAAIGLFTLTGATLGVGLVAGACFLGILARMAQAASQHRRLMERLNKP